MIAYAQLFLVFMKFAALSFGGAWSIWALISREIVAQCDTAPIHLCAADFNRIFAFAELLPGPQVNAISITAFADYGIAGMAVAVLALVSPGVLIMPLLIRLYHGLSGYAFMKGFFTGAKTATLAILLLFAINLAGGLITRPGALWAIVIPHIALVFLLSIRLRMHPFVLVALGGVAGFFLCGCMPDKTHTARQKAVAYLEARGDALQPVAVPILQHLVEKHGIAVNFEAAKKKRLTGRNPNQVFMGSISLDLVPSRADIERLRGVDRLSATAVYCIAYGLPGDFFASVRNLAARGNYELTHAAFALVMIRRQACSYDKETYRRELGFVIFSLRRLLNQVPVVSDLGIEAVLMLQLTREGAEMAGEPSYVNPAWIDAIIAAQRPDGSWAGDDHTTVIALWLLLERARG